MTDLTKSYVHLAVDAVDTVIYDPEGRYDPERYDRYATYEEARDAALTCIELMLYMQDYDGEDHQRELEAMLPLLEGSETFEHLQAHRKYKSLIRRLRRLPKPEPVPA